MTRKQSNQIKYLKAPSIDEIRSFVNELDVSIKQFERFYGLPEDTVKKSLDGSRKLPAAYWEIIYLKQRPMYGNGYCPTDKHSQVIKKTKKNKKQNVISNQLLNKLSQLYEPTL